MPNLTSSQPRPRRVPLWDAVARSLRTFAKSRRGAVAVEFAMIVPLLIALILGGFDIGRYALLHQKAQRTAATVADLLASAPFLTNDTIDDILTVTDHVLRPFEVGDNARVIASMITLATDSSGAYITDPAAEDTTAVAWQRCWAAPGHTGLAANSTYGTSGNPPVAYPPGFESLPEDTTLTVMVAEVVYQHQYMFMDFLGDETPIRVFAVYLARDVATTVDLSVTANCG